MRKLLVTGSCGLIGSEVCFFFGDQNYAIHGIDNNQRAVFFGPQGDTRWMQAKLKSEISGYVHHDLDIREREGVLNLFKEISPDAIVHTAAQPSHDKAASIPFDDFDVNAVGTLNLLEAARRFSPESPFVHMSTNKVYGDTPNKIKLKELETRWDYDDALYQHGIAENLSIDQSKHSLFGASKVAGRYSCPGVWKIFWYVYLLSARRVFDRSESYWSGIAWFLKLPCKMQSRRTRVYNIWI